MPNWIVIVIAVAAATLALLAGLGARLTHTREGKILAFVTLFILPTATLSLGFSQQMSRAKTLDFCVSCHVMEDYGKSLHISESRYIPAIHFQNSLVPRETTCYSCHTKYTMFGPIDAKIEGVRHLMVQYLGAVPRSADVKLYAPYDTGECLHCHLGQRRFEEFPLHSFPPAQMAEIKSGAKSCMSSGCHSSVHSVGKWDGLTFWQEVQ